MDGREIKFENRVGNLVRLSHGSKKERETIAKLYDKCYSNDIMFVPISKVDDKAKVLDIVDDKIFLNGIELNSLWNQKILDRIILDEEEQNWKELSVLLTHTSEYAHLLLIEPIILETKEDLGLSSLEKLSVNEIWQDPFEGIITFKVEGCDKEFDLDDYPELINQIRIGLISRLQEF